MRLSAYAQLEMELVEKMEAHERKYPTRGKVQFFMGGPHEDIDLVEYIDRRSRGAGVSLNDRQIVGPVLPCPRRESGVPPVAGASTKRRETA